MQFGQWGSRAITSIVLLFLVWPGIASTQPQPPRTPAPSSHQPTGLAFPPRIAHAELFSSNDYGKSHNRPDLGYSWNYGVPNTLTATVYVYNLGNPSIPSGAANPVVLGQFQQSLGDIYAMAKNNRYDELKTVKGPADCAVGNVVFRCITLSAIQATSKTHVFTGLMVTGYRNYFLKLRLDWLEGSSISQAEADRFVQTMVSTIMR